MLVEAITYRFRGHSMADPEEYRTKEQVAEWRKRDPIATFAERLVAEGVIDEAERERIDEAAIERVDEAVEFADALALPAARVALRRRLRARRPGARAGTRSTSAPPACTAARTSASSPTAERESRRRRASDDEVARRRREDAG